MTSASVPARARDLFHRRGSAVASSASLLPNGNAASVGPWAVTSREESRSLGGDERSRILGGLGDSTTLRGVEGIGCQQVPEGGGGGEEEEGSHEEDASPKRAGFAPNW